MARKKEKVIELGVFKGREARLNRAVFQVLTQDGPQTIYDLHKQIKKYPKLRQTHYANVNKRVRALEQQGYLRIVNVQNSKAGFEMSIYEPTSRAYLSIFIASRNIDALFGKLDEATAMEILASFLRSEEA